MADILAPPLREAPLVEHEAREAERSLPVARLAPVLPATIWAVLFIAAPLLLMLVYSFWRYRDYAVVPEWNLGNYLAFFHSSAYSTVLLRTALLSLLITLISVCLAYPFAYFLVRVPRRLAVVLVVMVMIPLWANTIVRNFVWFSILGERGLINSALTGLGIVAKPVPILFTPTAVLIVGVYISISFAALALFPVLEKISPSLVESAKDLGATPLGAFRRVTLPLSLAGVQAAALLVFVPTLGLFITPMLLGGPNATMMANLVVPFFNAILNYAQGAALSFVALVLVVIAMIALGRSLDLEKLYASGVGSAIATRSAAPTPWGLRLYAGGFLLFLFLPVIMLVVFSLNESMDFPLRGWTVDWYYQVLTNPIVADAATNTLIIGFSAALIAIAICAPLAYGIVRFQYRFGGLLKFLVLLPMVVPGFMLGAALLVVLNKVGLAFTLTAIIIGHVTYVLPFVFLVLLAQQQTFDRSLEEAARDLGASDLVIFRKVTLPLMLPAILAGALFAFTLSLDEFIITFLLSGSTLTIPMYIYGLMKGGVSPAVNALGALLLAAAIAVLLLGRAGLLLRALGRSGATWSWRP